MQDSPPAKRITTSFFAMVCNPTRSIAEVCLYCSPILDKLKLFCSFIDSIDIQYLYTTEIVLMKPLMPVTKFSTFLY